MGAYGRLGLSLGGAIIGGLLGGQFGAALGAIVGSIAGQFLFPIESPDVTNVGPRIEDLTLQTSTYGGGIAAVWGTVRLAGNILWAGPLVEHEHRESQEVGGKGGGGQTVTNISYTYTASFAIGLCKGPIIGIKRVWADDKLVFDFTNPPAGVSFNYQLYLGTETQLPDPTIEADKGAGNVPAHRGLAYIVFTDLDLTPFGNRIPNLHFEVVAAGTTAVTATVASDGVNGTLGRLAIDEETGLIWATRSQDGGGKLRVYRPDTLAVVHERALTAAYGLSYQPPFSYLKADALTGEVQIKEMPPRMYVGQGFAQILGGRGHAIETRSYLSFASAISTNVLFSPSAPIVDRNTINFVTPIQEDAAVVIWGNGVNLLGTRFVRTLIGEFDGWGPAVQEFQPTPYTVSAVADMALGVNCLYVLDSQGYVFKLSSTTYQLDAVVRPAAAFADISSRIAYDRIEDKVYVKAAAFTGARTLYKYSSDLSTLHWSKTETQLSAAGTPRLDDMDVHNSTGELWALISAAPNCRVVEIDKSDGSVLQELLISNISALAWAGWDFQCYPNSMFAIASRAASPSGVAKIPLVPAPTSAGVPLSTIVGDVAGMVGLSGGDYDVSELTDTVTGFAVGNRMAARSALETLMRAYFFDAIESDYQVKFPKRGRNPVATIPYADLAAHGDGESVPAARDVTRAEENELPYQIDVRYIDQAAEYKSAVQYDRRLIGNTREVAQADIPLVLTADQAKRIASIHLYTIHMDRVREKVRLSGKYAALDPADVVTLLDEAGAASTYRLTSVEFSPPNLVEAELAREETSVYTSPFVGVSPTVPAQAALGVVPTLLALLDIPILRDQDDTAGIYAGVTGVYEGWAGAELFKSSDGLTYTGVQLFQSQAVSGTSETVLSWSGAIY